MELPLVFRDLTIDDDPSTYHAVAQSLAALQDLFGPINKFSGQGKAAKHVLDLLKRINAEQGALEKMPGIDHVVVLDRGIDLLSTMATQLTYEGLIDELFKINYSNYNFLSVWVVVCIVIFYLLANVRRLFWILKINNYCSPFANFNRMFLFFLAKVSLPAEKFSQNEDLGKKNIFLNSSEELFVDLR